MQKFAGFFLLFCGCFFALDRAGAYVLDRLHERIVLGQRGGLVRTYLQLPAIPRLLVMGNSRTAVNVCPDSLAGAFSIAHNGTTQIFQTGLLSVLRQRQRLPSAILLHVDLDEYSRPSKQEDIRRLKFFYRESALVRQYSREALALEPLKHSLALYRHNGRLPSMLGNWWRQRQRSYPLNQGYEPSRPAPTDSQRTVYSLARLNAAPPVLNRAHLRYLRDFIALCRQERIRLVCFTSTYYQVPRHVPATAALIDSLLRAEGIPYLNYARAPIPELSRNLRYWRDATHLNTRGIPLQSQVLARDVRRLLAPANAHPPGLATTPASTSSPGSD